MLLWAGTAYAQFSGSIKGVVQDPSGAAVPSAKVELLNTATRISHTTTTDPAGNYEFVSLAPGAYEVTVEATGFVKEVVNVTLETNQTLNVPIPLTLKAVTQTIEVTGAAPVLNTAETRNQMTLENQGVAELPVMGRNLVTLATLAPGVTGLGTTGSGVPGGVGTPGSGVDNYSTETQVDASANGEGQMSNMWVIDGLDVTSGIRQGVLNLTPNPDSIQETSIQVNTFTAEYGRSDGLQVTMTTKSGSDKFHGFADDYFNYQGMFARTEFTTGKYGAFHSNNMSFGVGGPVIPHKQFFFFADIEPLRSSQASTVGGQTFADPAFVTWAQTNFADTVGTGLLGKYAPAHLSGVTVSETADRYLLGAACPSGQTTIPITGTVSIPCSLDTIDNGSFSSTAVRNGTQWFVRIDKYFSKDRVYGSFYRTTLTYGEPTAVPQFSPASNNNWQRAYQFNWAHTFTPTTLNEATFGGNRVEGTLGSGAPDYTVPDISVTGITADGGRAFGVGFAQGDFIQHNYHWRDVLTHIRGTHTLKFGYEGWFGDDVEPFQGPYSVPNFNFTDLTTLVQDQPRNEGSAMYDPTTGKPVLWSWNAASTTWGLFAQDVWKVKPNLSLTLGLRWDDQGNPYTRSATTVFGNYYLGPATSSTNPSFTPYENTVANGFAKSTHNALNHSVSDLLSPTIGFAWDPTRSGVWALRGGFGVYNNWLTQANVQEEFRGNPPGPVEPTFVAGGSATAGPPIFVLGNSNKPPFGFTYPAFTAGLNSVGGITGLNFPIGGINPNLKSPRADIWAVTLERKIGSRYVASVGYSGSHSYALVGNNDQQGIVSYGVDINAYAGDLIQHESLTPTRLNPSFGSITYSDNNRYGNYEALFVGFRGRFSRGFFDASYTRSDSKDDAGSYPTALNPAQYYGPSPWDAPNRFSLTLNYSLRGLSQGKGVIGHLTGGWGVSGTSIFQSGYPFTVINTNLFIPVCQNGPTQCPSLANPITGLAANSGDYNADGDDKDYPNVASYVQGTTRHAFLQGVFANPSTQFTVPTLGTEGNEKQNGFREPNFAETDAAFYKNNPIKEHVNLQIRFEFFNLFNRPNLGFVDANPPDVNFGKSTTQQGLPRWWDVAAKITF
jgi:hypothetical protein